MQTKTPQVETWSGDFGREYTSRNPHTVAELDAVYERQFGLRRTALNQEFLGQVEQSARVLEVGANVGIQLQALQEMDFASFASASRTCAR
jgi:hypothetical protein